MKIKISLLLAFFTCLFLINSVSAQISLSGPTTVVPSGTIVRFTATGETANKYIGSVPTYAEAQSGGSTVPGVSAPLWNTNYYTDNHIAGKFDYKLVNTNSVAKTVTLSFGSVLIVTTTGTSTSYSQQNIYVTVTIAPAPVPVYLVAGSSNGEWYMTTNEASIPFGYGSHGMAYKAFSQAATSLGTVPVYEFTGSAYNSDGSPAFPAKVYYYSTSGALPVAALSGGGTWQIASKKIAFYAFTTPVAGTVPVKCFSNTNASLYIFLPGEDDRVANSVVTHTAFYAYPWDY
jgi:hypothetical protein